MESKLKPWRAQFGTRGSGLRALVAAFTPGQDLRDLFVVMITVEADVPGTRMTLGAVPLLSRRKAPKDRRDGANRQPRGQQREKNDPNARLSLHSTA